MYPVILILSVLHVYQGHGSSSVYCTGAISVDFTDGLPSLAAMCSEVVPCLLAALASARCRGERM